jgi:hypothetical protein
MGPKTYGQIAYEAYCEKTGWKSLVSGDQLPPFNKLVPAIQEAWAAAANAVVNAVTGRGGR